MTRRPPSPAEFRILLALADGPKHGHGIRMDVHRRTHGDVDMGAGTLYGAIKRLLRRAWIREVTDTVPDVTDERLRYYAVTPEGLEAARAEVASLSALLGIAEAKRLLDA